MFAYTKIFRCSFCNVELNLENSGSYGFTPCCKTCEEKKKLNRFSAIVGNVLNNHKGFDIGYYIDKDTEKVIVMYKGERFTLKVERWD